MMIHAERCKHYALITLINFAFKYLIFFANMRIPQKQITMNVHHRRNKLLHTSMRSWWHAHLHAY